MGKYEDRPAWDITPEPEVDGADSIVPRRRPKDHLILGGVDPTQLTGRARTAFADDVRAQQHVQREQVQFDAAEAREQERMAKEAAAEEKKRANSERESKFRQAGISHYTDAYGNIQADKNEDGSTKFKTSKAKDYSTGESVTIKRDDHGVVTASEDDANAPIGPHKDRPHELYRQDKKTGWNYIGTVSEGLKSTDGRVRQAAESANRKLEQEAVKTGLGAIQSQQDELNLQIAEIHRSNRVKEGKILDLSKQQEAIKADPEWGKTQGGMFGILAKPTDRAKILQDQHDALNSEIEKNQPEPFDPKVWTEKQQQLLQEKRAWQGQVRQSGSVSAAIADRRSAILSAGGDPDQDPIISAVESKRKDWGFDTAKEQSEIAARRDPEFGPLMKERDALEAETTRLQSEVENAGGVTPQLQTRIDSITAKEAALNDRGQQLQSSRKQQFAQETEKVRTLQSLLKEPEKVDPSKRLEVLKALPQDKREEFLAAERMQQEAASGAGNFNDGELPWYEEAGRAGYKLGTSIASRLLGAAALAENFDPTAQVLKYFSGQRSALDKAAESAHAYSQELDRTLPQSASIQAPDIEKGKLGDARWWLIEGAKTVTELGIDLGLSALTGPAAPITFMALGGAKMAGDSYNDAVAWHRANGKEDIEARYMASAEGALVGVVGALLDRIPAGEFLIKSKGGREVLTESIRKRLLKRGLAGFAAESVPEVLQEITQMAAEAGFRDPAKAFEGAWTRLTVAGVLGGAAGSAVDVSQGAVSDVAQRKQREQNIRTLRAQSVLFTPEAVRDQFSFVPSQTAVAIGVANTVDIPDQLAEIDIKIGEIQSQMQTVKGSDFQASANALESMLTERQQLVETAVQARKMHDVAEEIDAIQGQTPEGTAQGQAAARALVKIATGQPLESLTVEERSALETPAADGLPKVEMVNGKPVITEGARARLAEVAPKAAELIPSEQEQRQTILQQQTKGGESDEKRRMQTNAKNEAKTEGQGQGQVIGNGPNEYDVTIEEDGSAEPQVVRVRAASEQQAMETAGAQYPAGKARAIDAQAIAPAESSKLVDNVVERAVRKIQSKTVGILSDSAKATVRKRVTTALKNLAAATKKWGGLLQVSIDESTNDGDPRSAGVQVSLEKGIVLRLDDIASAGNLQSLQDPKYAELAIQEEVIHHVALDAESKGEIDPLGIWKQLPKPVKDAISRAYVTAKTDHERAHEMLRMLVQGRLTGSAQGWSIDGKIVTEQASPALLAKLREALEKILQYLKDLRGELQKQGATPETIQSLDSAVDLIATRVKTLNENQKAKEKDSTARKASAGRTVDSGRVDSSPKPKEEAPVSNDQAESSDSELKPDKSQGGFTIEGKTAEAAQVPADQLADFLRGKNEIGAKRLTDTQLTDLSHYFDIIGDQERLDIVSAEFERRMYEEAESETGKHHYELLEAVTQLGGIPANDPVYGGELKQLRETPGGRKPGLLRNSADNIDTLRGNLEDYGFRFETPDDLLNALYTRLTDGKPIFGTAATLFSQPAKLTYKLKQGDVVDYNGNTKTVYGVLPVEPSKLEAEHWLEFTDGSAVKITGAVRLPVVGKTLSSQPAFDPEKDYPAALYSANLGLAGQIAKDFQVPGMGYDDLAQEAKLSLVEAAKAWKPQSGEFRPYAARSIRNKMIDLYRRQNRKMGRETELNDEAGELLDSGLSPVEQAVRNENIQIVRGALAELPAKPRELIEGILRGETVAEIAQRMGVSKQGAGKVVQEALRRMRGKLGERGLTLSSQAVADDISNLQNTILSQVGSVDPGAMRMDFHVATLLGRTMIPWSVASNQDTKPIPDIPNPTRYQQRGIAQANRENRVQLAALAMWPEFRDRLADIAASLPDRRVRDGRSGKIVDPFDSVKRALPNGKDIGIVGAVKRALGLAQAVFRKNRSPSFIVRDYLNILEVLRDSGAVTGEQIENGIRELTALEGRSQTTEEALNDFADEQEGSVMLGESEKQESGGFDVYTKLSSQPNEWPSDFPRVAIHTTVPKLRSHPRYQEAKSGGVEAAFEVVGSVFKPERALALSKQFPNAKLVAIHAEEATGRNKLPIALAEAIEDAAGLQVSFDIVQSNKSFHTGKSAAWRMLSVAKFTGPVIRDEQYIIVDDVATSGSTLAALRNYIESNGGKVVAATTLATTSDGTTGYGGDLALKPETREALEKRFTGEALDRILEEYGIAPSYQALTNSQGRYILSFSGLDSFRNRIVTEGLERQLPAHQESTEEQSEGSVTEDESLSAQPNDSIDELFALLNEPELDAVTAKAASETPGERTVGRPDLAHGADSPEWMGVDEVRNISRETERQWEYEAQQMLDSDYSGTMQKLIQRGLAGGTLNPAETKAAQLLVARELEKGSRNRRLVQGLIFAYRETGTAAARQMRARVDPFKSPADRHREFLAKIIYTPPASVRRDLEKATTPQEKQRILDTDAKRIARIEAELAKMGITFDDIFRGEVELRLKGAPIVKNIVATFDEKRKKAFELIQGGTRTWAGIAQEVGLTAAEVEKVRDQFVEEFRRRHFDKFKKGLKADAMEATRAVLSSQPDATITDEEAEAEFQRALAMMGIVSKERQGKMRVKKKRAKLLVPVRPGSVRVPDDSPVPFENREQSRLELSESDRNANDPRMPVNSDQGPGRPGAQRELEYEPEYMFKFDLSDPMEVIKIGRGAQAANGNAWDMAYEYWINSILSGPQTHVVNVAGNSFSTAWDFTIQRAGEALLNLVYRDAKSAQFGEFKWLARGFLPGLSKALRLAAEAWTSEAEVFSREALNQQLEFSQAGKIDAVREVSISGKLGRVVRIPSRALLWADTFFKVAIGQMEVGAQAYRIAKAEGLEGEAFASRISGLINTPGSVAWLQAVDKATSLTFQAEIDPESANPLDRAVSKVQQLARSTKLVGFFLPFVKTPYNIFKMGLRKTPFGAIGMLANFSRAGFYRVRDGKPIAESYVPATQIRDLVEQTIAWTTMALLWGMTEGDDDDENKGILLTGSRPFGVDPQGQRDLNSRAYGGPYMLRIGGRDGVTIPFGRYEPFATVLGTVADTVRAIKMRNSGAATTGETMDKLMGYFQAQVEAKTFLQGLSDLLQATQDPSKLKEVPQKVILGAIVPNLIKQPLRNLDDYYRDSKGGGLAYQMLPAPGLAEPSVDVYGNDVKRSGVWGLRMLFPSGTKPYEQLQPVDQLLLNWNRLHPADAWAPNRPQRSYQVKKQQVRAGKLVETPEAREMDAQQYRQFSLRAGYAALRALRGRFTDAQIANPSDADVKSIKQAFEDARSTAREDMLRAGLLPK